MSLSLKITLRSLLLICIVFLFSTCRKKTQRLPLITTIDVSEISEKSARGGGVVYFEGDAPITAKGLCWSTISIPTIDDDKTDEGPGEVNFSSLMTGLNPLTRYVVRAYATNKWGTAYSQNYAFTTTVPPPLPFFTASKIYASSPNTISVEGTIYIGQGTGPILEAGYCWDTNPLPVKTGSQNSVATVNSGKFSGTITGLTANTTYYVRIYATNSTGTTYHTQAQVKTFLGTVTDIEGNVYNTVKIGPLEWTAENLRVKTYRDGTPIAFVSDYGLWSQNSQDGMYSYFGNEISNQNVYGPLYNWYAVTSSHKIAPSGWHVPTRFEWDNLVAVATSGNANPLQSNISMLWKNNPNATNTSGFTALPGGVRYPGGYFNSLGYAAYFWSSSMAILNGSYSTAHYFELDYYGGYGVNSDQIAHGMSVRLVKD